MSDVYKNFPREKIDKVKKAIDRALAEGAEPLAAFDADGTLWNMDMGEHFFSYQIESCGLKNLPADPWKHYHELKVIDPPTAYLWLAQINQNISLTQVREWADLSYKKIPSVPVFSGVHEIIKHLQKSGVEIFIVTASIKWAVEPGARFLNIPDDHVIGIATEVKNGIVSHVQAGAITWREGKVTGLLNSTGRRTPFFSAGNTMGDLALLDCASHIRLVNAAVPPEHENFTTEQTLVEIARKRGWFYLAADNRF